MSAEKITGMTPFGYRKDKDIRLILKALVDKLEEIEQSPQYKGVWGLYHVHGGKYTGPDYVKELEAARAALGED